MNEALITALISASIPLIGILQSSRLVRYRLTQLEEKVDRHNDVIERLYKVEERSKSNTHRLDQLEECVRKTR